MQLRNYINVVICAGVVLLAPLSQARNHNLPEFTDLIEKNSPAVVKINTVERSRSRNRIQVPPGQNIPDIFRYLFEPRNQPERNVHSMGSGFVISADGYVLTNNHVIDGADEIVVRLIDRREFTAEVVGRDERSDLALLKIEADDLPTLKFAEPDELRVGEWVLAIGSPFGLDYSASVGIVSAIGRSIPTDRQENYVPFIQTDVAINPGNSGGPLFNLDGEVVGINSQIYTRSGGSIGLSFAIPISVAKQVVSQLKDKGRVDRGWLGVVIQEVDRDLASSFGLKKPMGALIAELRPGGPADRAGLKVGDVIVKFDKTRIQASSELPHVVGASKPGEEVPVTVMREGKRRVIDVEVGTLGGDDEEPIAQAGVSGDRLGVVVNNVDERMKDSWQIAGGVLVEQVEPDSPASRAGLRPGDVIAQLAFKDIDDLATYNEVQAELPTNELLPIRFFRQGRPAFRTIMIKE
ncbi:DegQ family serine endoprotease [Exilibacterium tricleocarpae]|uniref:Probable periplasmic serine endoprotease DegP-like n=1 Tax=Exilibacterium tricleocarpae TaxID=2591008 RepID=A0A545U3K1_9GAMM|nr:DegQ family serine endoprotease [Exilibacterium tricleocarpae]TQV84049.1 DegQ family serine endoprotease [Exilibacterium tricleocarpae]